MALYRNIHRILGNIGWNWNVGYKVEAFVRMGTKYVKSSSLTLIPTRKHPSHKI